jgi:peptidoglycan LD-endopeptidase CwlK
MPNSPLKPLPPRSASLDLLWPTFRERLERGLAAARAAGLQVHVFEANRTTARQAALYAQGRTEPGPVVTRARAGFSWHQYGVAADLVFDGAPEEGVQWSWDGDYVGEKKGDYERLGAIMQMAGLEWYGAVGAPFIEMPHFQLSLGMNVYDAMRIAERGGNRAVWAELERRLKGRKV